MPIAREARQEPWGLHEMHVVDPDGVTLIFVQIPPEHPLRRDTREVIGSGRGVARRASGHPTDARRDAT